MTTELQDAARATRLTANVIAALAAQTAAEASAPTLLASITFDFLNDAPADEWTKTEIRIERVTKSLVFSSAELRNGDGSRLLAATAIHKVLR